VVRGTAGVRRRRTVSTRLSEAEWGVWDAARAGSGRAEMGAWVRAVVDEVVGAYPAGGRPGDVPRVPEVNAAAYGVLVGAAHNLNQLTRYAHAGGQLSAGIEEAIDAVVGAAFAVRGMTPPGGGPGRVSGSGGRGGERG